MKIILIFCFNFWLGTCFLLTSNGDFFMIIITGFAMMVSMSHWTPYCSLTSDPQISSVDQIFQRSLADRETEANEAAIQTAELIQKLNHSDREIRESAMAEIQKRNDTHTAMQLIEALKDSDPSRRAYVVYALYQIQNPISIPALIEALHDENYFVRRTAAMTLGELGDARAVLPLMAAMRDRQVRLAAAEALGRIGDARAVPVLLSSLNDRSDRYLRLASAKSLGLIGDERAISTLIKSTKTSDQYLKLYCEEALEAIQKRRLKLSLD